MPWGVATVAVGLRGLWQLRRAIALVLSKGGLFARSLPRARSPIWELFQISGPISSPESAHPTLIPRTQRGSNILKQSSHGWLAKLWSLFGSYLGDPKGDHNFDNRPHTAIVTVGGRSKSRRGSSQAAEHADCRSEHYTILYYATLYYTILD